MGVVRIPRPSLLAIGAIVLLVLGGLATFWTFAWWTDSGYVVSVAVPDEVSWSLWVPDPGTTIPWTTDGSAAVVGPLDTPFGVLLNLTGTGPARVRFSTTRIGFGADPFQLRTPINLSGREGQWPTGTYRVWRQSSDAAANMSVASGLPFSAARLDESWQCGGSGFSGYPAEGWNILPIGFGDCVGLISSVPGLIPAALLVPGSVMAIIAWRRRNGGGAERTGFSPRDASGPRHG